MYRRQRWVKNIVAILGLAAALIQVSSHAADTLVIGDPVPDFTLKSSQGQNLRLSEFKGNVVLINFWATWCTPCRKELPMLDELYIRYQRAGFALLGINIDVDAAKPKAMIAQLNFSFPSLFDSENKVSQLYSIDAMPTTLLLDRQGRLRYVHFGYQPGYETKYEAEIRQLLKE